MKRTIICFVFILCFLLSVASGSAVAETITHSVSASLVQYTTVDPPQTTYIQNPQMIDLFDVTFDDSSTSCNYYDSNGNMFTMDIDDFLDPNAVFLSNASFIFNPLFLDVYSLLGTPGPNEGTLWRSIVSGGLYDEDHPKDSYYYTYWYHFYTGNTGSGWSSIWSRSSFMVYEDEFPSQIMGSGFTYDRSVPMGDDIDWGNSALYGDLQYQVVPSTPVPEPATLLLLGTGLVGLAGFRRRFRKK